MADPPATPARAGLSAPVRSLSRLYHTVRFLRREQIVGQLRLRLRAVSERPERFAARAVPAFEGVRWAPREPFLAPGPGPADPGALRAGAFGFQNRRVELGWPPAWGAPGLPRLWAYHLHYFEYLFSLPYPDGRALVLDWISRHTPARDRVGWEPYPTSLRVGNWCAYFFERHREAALADGELLPALWRSIFLQAEWLRRHLETHLLGNHLLENAAALALCGSCFAGEAARGWLRIACALLARELPEQILPDGGHFERSPMYQLRVATVLAWLLDTGDPALQELVEEPAARAVAATAPLQHPDGGIALLNDSAFGVQPEPSAVAAFWARVSGCPPPAPPAPGQVFALPDSGYFGARGDGGSYVVCDAGPVGPDHLPGHAHGDIFSFELSLGGRRVIRDAGVFGYEADALRGWCRSTRAHNTVCLDDADQCEFWAAFRVARRGRPRDVRFEPRGGGFTLQGWHDGYARLPGRPIHRRAFRWRPDGHLDLRDEVEGTRPVRVASRLHLHPECAIESLAAGVARVRHPAGAFLVSARGGALGREPSTYCPEFGRRQEGEALVFSDAGSRVVLELSIGATR